MAIPLLPLFSAGNNPAPANWVDALNQIINYLNTNLYYNPISGGGANITAYNEVTGATATAVINQGYLFTGNIGGPKDLYLPPATGSQGIVEVADGYGDAYTNPITAFPDGSDVIVGDTVTDSVYTNWASMTWRDAFPGKWVAI